MSGDGGASTRAELALRTAGDVPPLPVWQGRRVEWAPWDDSLTPLCPETQMALACRACGSMATTRTAVGTVHPNQGEQFSVTDQLADAWPVRTLSAHQCPDCGDYDLMSLDPGEQVEVIICDGCDRVCAAGATLVEARETLAAAGGLPEHAGGDFDLCVSCNPEAGE